jgi:SAM-dependent methyltransferase
MAILRSLRKGGRPSRNDLVTAQYDDAAAVAGYVAAHEGWEATARYFHSRFHAVGQALQACSGGELLDAGCGPGMLARHLAETRPGDFRITGCDQSPAMVEAAGGVAGVRATVARIEDLPFADGSFDVAIATGVLEYIDAAHGLRELARVVRPTGLVVVTMLNPLSVYRLFEWGVHWPALRLAGQVERLLGMPPERRHGATVSGIRAVPRGKLVRVMREVGLRPQEVSYFDLTPLVPPFDRLARRWSRSWRDDPERTVDNGPRRWMGTAYLVAARRE